MKREEKMTHPYNINCEVSVASSTHEYAQKWLEHQCTDDCDRCSVRIKCRKLWNEYACNITTGRDKYTLQSFQEHFNKIKAEKKELI